MGVTVAYPLRIQKPATITAQGGTSDSALQQYDWSMVQWRVVAIAAASFIVWIISLGHPIIVQTAISAWIGSVVLIIWTFFMPYVYDGS
jgi:hypothetical protein